MPPYLDLPSCAIGALFGAIAALIVCLLHVHQKDKADFKAIHDAIDRAYDSGRRRGRLETTGFDATTRSH